MVVVWFGGLLSCELWAVSSSVEGFVESYSRHLIDGLDDEIITPTSWPTSLSTAG